MRMGFTLVEVVVVLFLLSGMTILNIQAVLKAHQVLAKQLQLERSLQSQNNQFQIDLVLGSKQ